MWHYLCDIFLRIYGKVIFINDINAYLLFISRLSEIDLLFTILIIITFFNIKINAGRKEQLTSNPDKNIANISRN